MNARNDGDSVFEEPHKQNNQSDPDPSEAKAARSLRNESGAPNDPTGGAESVFDEPDILPGRPEEIIEQDWTCSNCGYNLRGMRVGHPCAECGQVELYRPPPPDAVGFKTQFERGLAGSTPATGWWIAAAAVVIGGVFAVAGTLMKSVPLGLFTWTILYSIIVGPAIEEAMKIATAAVVIERRPWLFRRVGQIQLATLGAAALFAVIENVLYLNVFSTNPSTGIIVWRWTACTTLHIACTAIAARGLIVVWRRTANEYRQPRFTDCGPALTQAIILHGLYNAAASSIEGFLG